MPTSTSHRLRTNEIIHEQTSQKIESEQEQKTAVAKVKNFQCPVCGKRFATRIELSTHKTEH